MRQRNRTIVEFVDVGTCYLPFVNHLLSEFDIRHLNSYNILVCVLSFIIFAVYTCTFRINNYTSVPVPHKWNGNVHFYIKTSVPDNQGLHLGLDTEMPSQKCQIWVG